MTPIYSIFASQLAVFTGKPPTGFDEVQLCVGVDILQALKRLLLKLMFWRGRKDYGKLVDPTGVSWNQVYKALKNWDEV